MFNDTYLFVCKNCEKYFFYDLRLTIQDSSINDIEDNSFDIPYTKIDGLLYNNDREFNNQFITGDADTLGYSPLISNFTLTDKMDILDKVNTDNINMSDTDNINMSDTDNINMSDTDKVDMSYTDNINMSYTDNINMSDTDNINMSDTDKVDMSYTDNINMSDTDNINMSDTDNINMSDTDKVDMSYTDNINMSDTDNINMSDTDKVDMSYTDNINMSDTDNINMSYTDKVDMSYTDNINMSDTDNINMSYTDNINMSYTDNINMSDTDKVDMSDTDNINMSDTDITNKLDTHRTDMTYRMDMLLEGILISQAKPQLTIKLNKYITHTCFYFRKEFERKLELENIVNDQNADLRQESLSVYKDILKRLGQYYNKHVAYDTLIQPTESDYAELRYLLGHFDPYQITPLCCNCQQLQLKSKLSEIDDRIQRLSNAVDQVLLAPVEQLRYVMHFAVNNQYKDSCSILKLNNNMGTSIDSHTNWDPNDNSDPFDVEKKQCNSDDPFIQELLSQIKAVDDELAQVNEKYESEVLLGANIDTKCEAIQAEIENMATEIYQSEESTERSVKDGIHMLKVYKLFQGFHSLLFAFNINFSGSIATVQGLRLGRLAHILVPPNEINTACALTLWLTQRLIERHNLILPLYQFNVVKPYSKKGTPEPTITIKNQNYNKYMTVNFFIKTKLLQRCTFATGCITYAKIIYKISLYLKAMLLEKVGNTIDSVYAKFNLLNYDKIKEGPPVTFKEPDKVDQYSVQYESVADDVWTRGMSKCLELLYYCLCIDYYLLEYI